jgi:hypothetical protein
MKLGLSVLLLLCGVLFASVSHADGIYGDNIVDFLYIAGHHLDSTLTADSSLIETNGYSCFDVRRVRFGFKRTLNSSFAIDFRLEAAVKDWYNEVTGASSSTATPFFKDAHGTWTFAEDMNLRVGIQGNPLFTTPENTWGYRQVEKIVTDLHRVESSRDIGVSVNGSLDAFNFTVMIGNGNGEKNETYEGRELYLVAGYKPMDDLVVEAGMAYEAEGENDDEEIQSHMTIQGFLGYRGDMFQGGVQYATYSEDDADDDPDDDLDISLISVFGAYHVSPALDIIARYDMVDENPFASGIDRVHMATNAPTSTIIAGVAWKPAGGLQVIPNVEYVSYGEPDEEHGGGDAPDSDTFMRLTFFHKW